MPRQEAVAPVRRGECVNAASLSVMLSPSMINGLWLFFPWSRGAIASLQGRQVRATVCSKVLICGDVWPGRGAWMLWAAEAFISVSLETDGW